MPVSESKSNYDDISNEIKNKNKIRNFLINDNNTKKKKWCDFLADELMKYTIIELLFNIFNLNLTSYNSNYLNSKFYKVFFCVFLI